MIRLQAPRVRRGGRAPVAILRPRQSQRAAVCQRPACRVPLGGAQHRPAPGGERQIGRYSFFLNKIHLWYINGSAYVDVEPVRRSASPMPLRRIILPSTNPTGGMPHFNRTNRIQSGPPDGGDHLPPAAAGPRHAGAGGAGRALPYHARRPI